MGEKESSDHLHLQTTRQLINGVSTGELANELDAIAVQGIRLVESRPGFLRFNFIPPIRLADKDGNWQAGAMATLIDMIGALAVYSFTGDIMVALDLSISFHSTAKIQEEVEIVAKILGNAGRIASAAVEIRRKNDGEVIASSKQWIASKM